jgi:hypothetical protein
MMLLYILVAAALLLLLAVRIAASPPFALLGYFFSAWAERCQSGGDLPR